MAEAKLSTIASALEQRFRARLARQQNRAAVTMRILPKRAGKGKNVAFDIQVGSGVGQYYSDGEDVAAYSDDTEVPGTIQWAEVGDAFAITGRAEDAAAGDGTELANLYMTKLTSTVTRTAAKLNAELVSGTGASGPPQTIGGLLSSSGPLDSTGTYATLARGTYAQFAGNVLANGGVPRAMQASLIERGLEQVYNATGMGSVDVYLTTPAIWRGLASAMGIDPARRQNQDITIRGQKFTLDAGFDAIEYNGRPIIKDKDFAAGNFVGLNLDHIGIEYLPVSAARKGEVLAMLPVAGTEERQPGGPGTGNELLGALSRLSRTGNKRKFQYLVTCQLWCDRPAAHFWIKDLVTPN